MTTDFFDRPALPRGDNKQKFRDSPGKTASLPYKTQALMDAVDKLLKRDKTGISPLVRYARAVFLSHTAAAPRFGFVSRCLIRGRPGAGLVRRGSAAGRIGHFAFR
jgi:hypothetical protein